MPITLASLVEQLQADVPPIQGVPTAAQYTQAVIDAVADLGRRVPVTKVATLAIVSGTASYVLPADFARLIRLASLTAPDGVLVTDVLIPVPRSARERWTIAGTTITFYPTPASTLDRALWYAATHVRDVDDTYTDLTDDRAQVALLKARATALTLQATTAAPLSYRATLGDQAVDKQRVAEALRSAATAWDAQYQATVARLVGTVGVRG